MPEPHRFSWIEKPHLAAMARPSAAEELLWLRDQGIQVIISLTESPLPRHWVNDAGLMAVHVPVPDLGAPSAEQLELCIATIRRAHENEFGVAVHCAAGVGRTGTVLAAWFISEGMSSEESIRKVRALRPGSVETPEQEQAVRSFGES